MHYGFIYVGLGGAVGAIGRYLISLLPAKTEFPVWTLVTNFAGALLIGFIVGVLSENSENSQKTALFWKTGVCGGFTTFSTFSLEALGLFEDGKAAMGGAYIALSVGLCIAGVFLGRMLHQSLFAK